MSMLKGVSRNQGEFKRGLLILALGCFCSANGFAQLNYVSDSRNVNGNASVNNVSQYNSAPYYTTSYSGDFSGSAAPSSPFHDFEGNINGTANFQGGLTLPGGPQPINISATATASQNSSLDPQELSYSSFEGSSGSPGNSGQASSQWTAGGSSLLQVSFQVLSLIDFDLKIQGTGDPFASSDSYSLSDSTGDVLFSGSTMSLLQHGQYGAVLDFSGTFAPGKTYTLSLDSQGELDGGGLTADLTVPEPSMTALAGLAFLVFLLRVRQIKLRAVPVRIARPRVEGRRSRS